MLLGMANRRHAPGSGQASSRHSFGSSMTFPIRYRNSGSCLRVAPKAPPPPNKPRLSYVGVARVSSEGMSPDKTQWSEKFQGSMTPPVLTKTDQDFSKQGLEFVDSKEGIVLPEVNDLFERVGFPRRDPVKLAVALEHTYAIVWVRATKQSRLARLGQMVGFARATSDGVLSATIWDVSVMPAWQRSGLGRAMMERLTGQLVAAGIPTITLYAEPNVVGMYERLGFVKDPEGIKGMAFQKQKQLVTSTRR